MASNAQAPEQPQAGVEGHDSEHDAWMRAKVEIGLAQSRDRTAMIPIEQVWRDLTVER